MQRSIRHGHAAAEKGPACGMASGPETILSSQAPPLRTRWMTLRAVPLVSAIIAACLLASCQEDVPESVASNAIPEAASQGAGPPLLPGLANLGKLAVPRIYTEAEGAGEAGICALDAINGRAVREAGLRIGSAALFGGWVGDSRKQVPDAPLLVFRGEDSSHAVAFSAGARRADVAAAHGSQALVNSGFNVAVRMDDIAPGQYTLLVVTDPASGTYCDLHAVVEMRP